MQDRRADLLLLGKVLQLASTLSKEEIFGELRIGGALAFGNITGF
jgi:hypothetical protein